MSKIRVLPDHVANQIAAGEVVERPSSVAKELIENSIDASARRISIDIEAGGRRLLRVVDDGEGMSRDDAVLAFERHATSKISRAEDLAAIATLGFRGEALASIGSVARVELIAKTEDETAATRVIVEGGKLRDVKEAAHPRGTTVTIRDLFFNVPARRKFLRSEATESYHLTNLVTHYALAHPETSFLLTNNGREILHAAPAKDLHERAYQALGEYFIESLLEVDSGAGSFVRVHGYVSAPRERRTNRDAQYLFVNGRYVRDRLISRALSEGYRSILPHGVYPAALLFLEIPFEEVDVNVHPAKTEVRFRRAAAVAEAVRDAVRGALGGAGYESLERRTSTEHGSWNVKESEEADTDAVVETEYLADDSTSTNAPSVPLSRPSTFEPFPIAQRSMEFATREQGETAEIPRASGEQSGATSLSSGDSSSDQKISAALEPESISSRPKGADEKSSFAVGGFPPLASAARMMREPATEAISRDIRPLGQLDESFIVASDDDGLLLIDQHVAHERILFDKYRSIEQRRRGDSQALLVPETFDLTPAQAAAFDTIRDELESYGFDLMQLSGRTVAIKAVPADLPAGEARNILSEVLDSIDSEKRGSAKMAISDEIAASLACRAAIKINTPLTREKMQWLIDRLVNTSSPTTCPHGRPIILRITTRDIERGFHRT